MFSVLPILFTDRFIDRFKEPIVTENTDRFYNFVL